MTKTLASKPD